MFKKTDTSSASATPQTQVAPWKILVVDDEPEVHTITRLSLGRVVFRGRPLEFLAAHSALQARRVLKEEPDVALAFIDVVMEHDRAGLDLVNHIRNELGMHNMRVILRTGQPGMAAERDVIHDLEINDYLAKTQVSTDRLYTSTLAALRNFDDLVQLEQARSQVERYRDEALAESELLRATMDAAVLAMATTLPTPDGALVGVNNALCRLYGCERDELLYIRQMPQLIAEADRARFADAIQALLTREKDSAHIELSLLLPGVGEIPAQLTAAVIWTTQGAPRLIVLQLLDLRERFEVDRQKNEFVATVSHELKTPLTAVIAASALLKGRLSDQDDPKARELLANIERNAYRLLRLVEDLIGVERLSAGQMALHLRPSSLRQCLDEVLHSAQVDADKAGVPLQCTWRGPDVMLHVSPERLVQVLMHLVGNAIKFSRSGSPVALEVDAQDGWVRIAVIDRGCGVPDGFRSRMFTRFTQWDASQSRHKSGIGLGLAYSRSLVELMHGQVGYESQSGLGSTFWVRFPRCERPVAPD